MEPLSGASLLDLAGAVDEPNPSFENTVEESFKKEGYSLRYPILLYLERFQISSLHQLVNVFSYFLKMIFFLIFNYSLLIQRTFKKKYYLMKKGEKEI